MTAFFQVFQRLHVKKHRTGRGIGLVICYKLVENHGSTSQVGEGITFRVHLAE